MNGGESGPNEFRLRRLLGVPELAWFVDRVRRRMERGEPLTGTVTLTGASARQRDAVEHLIRRPQSGAELGLRLEDVDAVLRTSGAHPDGLAAAVIALTGPVADRGATEGAGWRAAFAPLVRATAARPELAEWAERLRTSGAVSQVEPDPVVAAELLADLAVVVAALPTAPEPVGRFAERLLGSAGALDPERPVATLAFGAARVLGRIGDGEGAAWRREVWAAVGLLRDELSSTVLTLGLPGDDSPTGRVLTVLGEAGEPAVLTLRQLRQPLAWQLSGTTISVCQNPAVITEVADRLGSASAPLVCVGGQPGLAAMTLLRAAVSAGARLRYHGDFDWAGIRTGNVLFARLPCSPWRFRATDYLAAIEGTTTGIALSGDPLTCTWDTDLSDALAEHGRAVAQERVLDGLLADLGP